MESKKAALITGSSGGIGRAIAIRLARDGYHVVAHYGKNQAKAQETLARIRDAGGSGDLISFPVEDGEAVVRELDGYFKSHVDLNLAVLVNNAGTHQDGSLGLMSDEAFDEVIQANVYGPFFLMRWSIRKMIRQRFGSIVNIASLSGQTGNPGQFNYAASKAAWIAMTKTLSGEVGSRGIRVNAVAPGLIETDMISDIPQIDELKKRIPLGRVGAPEDVAGAVSFLCSADAAYVTGHTLSVNGGLFPT